MLPDNIVLDHKVADSFIHPRSRKYKYTRSYELGGVDINDRSQGLKSHVWQAWTDGSNIFLQRVGAQKRKLVTDTNIAEIDVTFDQNMQWALVYLTGNTTNLITYNYSTNSHETRTFSGLKNPRISFDDKNNFNADGSDIIFAYLKNGALCYRQQRDRYDIERVLVNQIQPIDGDLVKIGMGRSFRFLFYVKKPQVERYVIVDAIEMRSDKQFNLMQIDPEGRFYVVGDDIISNSNSNKISLDAQGRLILETSELDGATLAQKGIVQLNDTYANSTSLAATASSVHRLQKLEPDLITLTLPTGAGQVTETHNRTNPKSINAQVTTSDGVTVFANDPDEQYQFFVRIQDGNVIAGKQANTPKLDNQTVSVYIT